MAEVAVADRELVAAQTGSLPVGPVGRHGLGSWGVAMLIAGEAALFAFLLFSYYYTGVNAPRGWLLEPEPTLKLALPNTILLLGSSVVAWFGEHSVLHQRRGGALLGFGAAFVMAVVFAIVQVFEWLSKPFRLGTSSYASLYFVTTGFHMAHVIVGIGVLAAIFVWTALDYFSPRRHLSVSAGVLYWHFVDVVWLFVFATFYVTPYLGFGK
jgi:heme/copper-type cytochrome/quinol oxidase subunit 3